MSWPLYMDHHVPGPVTKALRKRGYDVLTADEDKAARRPDDWLLDRATAQGRIFVTHDEDLLTIADEWRQQQREYLCIVYSVQNKLSYAELIESLELVSSAVREDEVVGHVIYLPIQ